MLNAQKLFLRRKLGNHKGILIILLCAATLIFPNLGRDTLWNDEGDTVCKGLSIKQSGLPLAWDGRNFNAEDVEAVTENLLMVTLPWLPFYATAASMTLFGENACAARLPFALAGWATVLLVYLLVRRATQEKKLALYSAGMLLLSVQFFLYARSCRYYAFVMLFVCLALWLFLRLDHLRKAPVFALAVILLFYSSYLPAICVLAALAFLTVVYRPFHKYRRGFWTSLLLIAPATLPWLFWMFHRLSADVSAPPASLAEIYARSGQLMLEVAVTAPLLGWLGLLFLAKKPLLKKGRDLLVLCGAVFAVFLCAEVCIHGVVQMAGFGMRHYSGVVPLAAILSALLVSFTGVRWKTTVLMLLVLGTTHLGGNFLPWLLFKSERPSENSSDKAERIHVPDHGWQMIVRSEIPGYLLELCLDNPGTVSAICQTLREEAKSDDVLLVNYAWESIYFYTRLPQAGKIERGHPSYEIAKRHKLPDYVFDATAANWVVWRPGWGFYRDGLRLFKEAEAAWKDQGKTLVKIKSLKDTAFENRPDVYHHRFPVLGHIYFHGTGYQLPDAMIFRVE